MPFCQKELQKRSIVLLGCLLTCLLTACEANNIARSEVELVLQIKGDPYPLKGPDDVAVDQQGNIYVIDGRNNRIQKFDSSGRFLSMWGSAGQGDGEFDFLSYVGAAFGGVATDQQGNVYVADTANRRIQEFDGAGQFLIKWGSRGRGDGQFEWPLGIAVDGEGNVYVSDQQRHDIQKFDSNGRFLAKWGEYGTGDGQLNAPGSLGVDAQGNVYVADSGNRRIQKFDSDGLFLAKWGALDTADSQFSEPSDVAVDEQGNIYVLDFGQDCIQKLDSNGQFLAKWCSFNAGKEEFQGPTGVTADKAGNIYVADLYNDRVLKFRQRQVVGAGNGQHCVGRCAVPLPASAASRNLSCRARTPPNPSL